MTDFIVVLILYLGFQNEICLETLGRVVEASKLKLQRLKHTLKVRLFSIKNFSLTFHII